MQNKKTMIPKLRFPEFVDKGEWERKILENISPAIFDGTHQTPVYTDKGIPFFSVENIVSKNKNKFIAKVDHIIATNKNKPEKGDILITRIGKIGFSTVVDWEYDFSIYVTLATIKQSELFNSYFLHHYIQSELYQIEIRNKSLLNAVPCKINMKELRETKVYLPTVTEQKKIAGCLSSIDALITAQTQKVDTLKNHKKALMQQLFPSKRETLPLRFKKFKKKSKWTYKKIYQFAKITTGNKNTQDKNDNGKFPFFVRSQTIEKINSFSYDGEAILTSGDGVGVGKNFHYINGKFDFHQRVYCIYDFDNDVLGKFIYFYFSEHFFKRIMELNAKNSVDSVRQSMISEMSIQLPDDINEQQKITDCLSSIDKLINAQIKKIEILKTHKKGLMQQLFPS